MGAWRLFCNARICLDVTSCFELLIVVRVCAHVFHMQMPHPENYLSKSGILWPHNRQTGVRMDALHGDINQNGRERVMAAFKKGRTQCLVATDVAARGLDIDDVDLVVHYGVHAPGPPCIVALHTMICLGFSMFHGGELAPNFLVKCCNFC